MKWNLRRSKGRRKRENIAAETFRSNVVHSVVWVSKREGSKRDANFTSSKDVAWVRKRGNNRETFKVSVSSVFPKAWSPYKS